MPNIYRTQRFAAIDTLRGVAIVWMAVFHFCYDLNYFGWIHQSFLTDPVWTGQRTAIVSLFLFCAGLGQSIAVQQRQSWPRFWWRWGQVALCALLVSAGSWWMFPKTYIYFGVLHGIAVMLIVARLTAGWGHWLWVCGALAIALKYIAIFVHSSNPNLVFLDEKIFNWVGLIGQKPLTEDYVPVLPWLGVMWWGMAAGTWLQQRRPAPLQALPSQRHLAGLGRWSLSFYMLHQPVLMGLLTLAGLLRR
jgi:uncharacterized membrane protein